MRNLKTDITINGPKETIYRISLISKTCTLEKNKKMKKWSLKSNKKTTEETNLITRTEGHFRGKHLMDMIERRKIGLS